jgi:hypothetical protein
MSPAIGAIGRVLVHEALAVLATDLRDLLLRHLTLWRHPVSRHGLTISRTPVGWVGIVSRIVSGRAITLWYRIAWRHVALHGLWHATRWSKCNLCLARQIRPAFDLDNGFETVFYRRTASSRSAGRNAYAERKSLSWTTAKVIRTCHLDVSGEKDVLSALSLLNPLIVRKRYPDHLFVIFKHPSLNSNP